MLPGPATKPGRAIFAMASLALAVGAHAEPVKLLSQPHDPYGFPRPGPGQKDVPLRTSFFIELGMGDKANDTVRSESVTISLQAADEAPFEILSAGQKFAPGYSGKLSSATIGWQDEKSLAVYVTPAAPLKPSTVYTIRVAAKSGKGGELPAKDGTWTFTTAAAPQAKDLSLSLDLAQPPVQWHGAFFSGFCKPSFCTSDPTLISTYDLMAEARRTYPRAWSLQRDFWMTGLDDKPSLLPPTLPNIVRERETRRIVAVDKVEGGVKLKVEDFAGHEQYGIPAGRPVSADYHPGDEVLIADDTHDARAAVVSVDDAANIVLVKSLAAPPGGWTLKYSTAAPAKEDPHTPGRFALGGCYLRKFKPCGTPCYYWGRLDKEWDLAYRTYGRRLMPNFADAPGDLAIDGRNWTTAKDYAELHEVTRVMTDHLIERYGDASLTFVWSVFNEPDLGVLFWRSDWNELQRFYDYTTDAILRAFEDRGYDSQKVFIGGLELGGIFGVHLKVHEFLTHCSPRARGEGALPKNAAFADTRLDGKRSKRVEELCRAHDGKGAPCDFISIHSYNRSEITAAKFATAKEVALQIDPEYYAGLWINSHEACPNWAPPPDPAAADSYLGNGYYPTWCADVVARQLRKAAADPRYAYGETILTFWPFPNRNFQGLQNCTRAINVDDNADGKTDREVTIATPVFHFLSLLSTLGDRYWPIPEQAHGGHVIGAFGSRNVRDLRVVVYTHNALDTQSRSEQTFNVALELAGVTWPRVQVREYRFDREHNTYYRLGQKLRDRPSPRLGHDDCYTPAEVTQVQELSKLTSTDVPAQSTDPTGHVKLSLELSGNSAVFLVIEPARP
jgi:hypothetical protein